MMKLLEFRGVNKSYFIRKRQKEVLKNLFSREYDEIKAVQNLSFQVETADSIGIIGSNGAGKSTLIKLMTGILQPDAGSISYKNFENIAYNKRFKHSIGVVFGQKSQLIWDLPVISSFKLLKSIYKIPDVDYNKRLEEYSTILGANDLFFQPVRQLSLGQRMRCDILAALLHQPRILFLDEPTIGLDVVTKNHLREFIKHINQRYQTTIILTSHDMEDVASICEKVMIIDKGCMVYQGKLAEFKAHENRLVKVKIDFGKILGEQDLVLFPPYHYEIMDDEVVFTLPREEEDSFIAEMTKNFTLKSIIYIEEPIEHLIRRYYEGLGDSYD